MRALIRLVIAMVGGVVLLAVASSSAVTAQAAPVPAAPVPAVTAGDCVGSDRVWLQVVNQNGGGLATACVANPANGFAVLQAVGYRTASSGLVCEIAGYPKDFCGAPWNGTYWSYWTAVPGQGWVYAQAGPGGRTPPPGSLDGWCFTPPGSQSTQQSACRQFLTSQVNPATLSTAQPSSPPTTSAPAPTSQQPTSQQPTSRPPSTSRPPTSGPSSRGPSSSAPKPAQPSAAQPSAAQRASQPGSTQSRSGQSSAGQSSAGQPSSGQPSSGPSNSGQSTDVAATQPSGSAPTNPSAGVVNPSGSASGESSRTPGPRSDRTFSDQGTTAAQPGVGDGAGSPWGVIATAGLLVLGGGGFAGWRWLKARKG